MRANGGSNTANLTTTTSSYGMTTPGSLKPPIPTTVVTKRTAVPSAIAPTEEDGKTVLDRDDYEDALTHIIRRDYYPTVGEEYAPDSSLTAFHATVTSQDTVALQKEHAQTLACRRRNHNQRYANGKVDRNALFFPVDQSVSTTTVAAASATGGEVVPFDAGGDVNDETKIEASATRFPSMQKYATNQPKERHWEGSNYDNNDNDSDASTNLDETVVKSIRSEIRQGRQRQAAAFQQQHHLATGHGCGGGTGGTLFRLPPESSSDQRAGAVLREKQKQVQLLQQQQTPSSPLSPSPSLSAPRCKKRPLLPPPVRSSGSLGFALRAAYTAARPAKRRKKKNTSSSKW